MIREIDIDFNKKTIEFHANHFHKGDKTYPSYASYISSMYGDPPTMDHVIAYTVELFKQYNKALRDHYHLFIKNGKY